MVSIYVFVYDCTCAYYVWNMNNPNHWSQASRSISGIEYILCAQRKKNWKNFHTQKTMPNRRRQMLMLNQRNKGKKIRKCNRHYEYAMHLRFTLYCILERVELKKKRGKMSNVTIEGKRGVKTTKMPGHK